MDRLWRVRHLFERGGLPKRPAEGSRLGKGVSYRQKIPVGFLSLSGEHVLGDLIISGAI